ncbi:MAG: type II methionyl aminopeptidase [Candidatus Helarchaeota archaeon]
MDLNKNSDEIMEKYFKAGEILARVLRKTKEYIKPGKKLIDICEYAENQIRKNGAELAFPLNIGIDDVAAHYTSPIKDGTVIPENCLLKLDLGANIDGYLVDSAISLNIGDNEEYEKLIIAAESALSAAIKTIKSGVKVYKVGEIVEKVIKKFGFNPIRNLSGHKMRRYELHTGITVPNVKTQSMNSNYTFKEGDVFALEPFTTNGKGMVYSGKNVYIYALLKKSGKNLPAHIINIVNKIWSDRKRLPFSPRWYRDIPSYHLKQMERLKLVYRYPVLLEVSKGVVAQAEHTIIVNKDSSTILTQL